MIKGNFYFICFGAGIYQINSIKIIKSLGYKVITVDQDNHAPGHKYSDLNIIQSVKNFKTINKNFKKFKIEKNIVGFLTQAARDCTIAVSYFSKLYGLKSLNIKTAKNLNEKNKICLKYNKKINANLTKINKVKNEYPYVIKLKDKSGGLGIKLISSKSDLDTLIKKGLLSHVEKVYVENYLEEIHYSVVGIKYENKIKFYCILKKIINSNFSNDKIIFTNIQASYEAKIKSFCKKIISELNFNFGPFHFELIASKNHKKFFISEIEPSCIGSYISEILLPNITNGKECLVRDVINLILGKEINLRANKIKKHAIMQFFYEKNLLNELIKKDSFKKYNTIIKKNYLIQNKKGLAKGIVFFQTESKKKFEKFKKIIT